MRIFVKAKPQAKMEKVEKIGESQFEVLVKGPAIQGKANKAIIRALSGFLSLS